MSLRTQLNTPEANHDGFEAKIYDRDLIARSQPGALAISVQPLHAIQIVMCRGVAQGVGKGEPISQLC